MRTRAGPSHETGGARWRAWVAPGDLVLIAALAVVAAALPAWGPREGPAAESAVVSLSGGAQRELSLSRDGRYGFPGPLGMTTVEVREGALRVVSSPCPNQLCVMRGAVRRPGEVVACVPNGVVVELVGRSPRVDGVTGP